MNRFGVSSTPLKVLVRPPPIRARYEDESKSAVRFSIELKPLEAWTTLNFRVWSFWLKP